MTTKAAFSPSEWQLVLEGPPAAGLLVISASHGGTFRETIAMSKAYAEARAQHGESELLDEIVSERPRVERGGKVHTPEELRDQQLACLTDATALLEDKATVQERDDYRHFVLTVANKVAAAHREGGQQVSPAEAQAVSRSSVPKASTGPSAPGGLTPSEAALIAAQARIDAVNEYGSPPTSVTVASSLPLASRATATTSERMGVVGAGAARLRWTRRAAASRAFRAPGRRPAGAVSADP
jgi:hypothetical protein